jgi:hypothetical protein
MAKPGAKKDVKKMGIGVAEMVLAVGIGGQMDQMRQEAGQGMSQGAREGGSQVKEVADRRGGSSRRIHEEKDFL